MKLRELYNKPIDRAVNPAVSATKFDPETERIEIQEYVFTDEIINGLFRILNAIKNNKPYDHVGIWIDGYYGSGKSHFLKYLDYCITPRSRDAALSRLLEAVKAVDPMDDRHNLGFDYDQLLSVANWLKRATIDTCIFNLETSYDSSTDKKKAFLHVFWNEFNDKRGFNKFNITLAQNLEKPLQEKGVFEEFKQRIAGEGADWNDPGMAADLIDNELDWVLGIAKELAPTLSIDSIRERIIRRDTTMSIDRFGMELAAYLSDKGDDYRLIFLADEVSQFINKERDRYLNLQEIITKLSEACDNKVWVACTAQQELSEIMDDCNIIEEKDKEGKIKGRFEVKVSLKGTQPEVITQKRILDKKEEVKDDLADLYEKYKTGFDLQFKLPTSYSVYDTEQDFIDYYPFVPYQFKLIMQVFNSFLNLGYVAKEVKGNERSIIKVVHSTAKANAEASLGKFISFDELYNNMFEEGLQARGQKAVNNAISMARQYDRDPKFAVRVANVLFMICNISQTDQLVFPVTLDNVTSLLVNDMETPRLTIKNEVEKVIDFLCDNNIIRREQGKLGAPDTFSIYSEEEMKVAQLIQSQVVDNNTQAEQLKEIFNKYITALKNKELYHTRSFAVGLTIKQRTFLANNPDVQVEFMMDTDYETADQLAMQNSNTNRMIYYVGPQYRDNKRLYNNFYWYCQATRYMATPATGEDNAKTRKEFAQRAEDLYNGIIRKEFEKILDSCPIVSGLSVIDETELGQKRGNDRYRAAMDKHLSGIYTKAAMVDSPSIPRTSEQLRKAILRSVNPGDYEGPNAALIDAEREVEIYLDNQFREVNVSDVLAKFAKAPYGWDNICTLYIINELVRRHRRDYSYNNNPNVETSTVANRIVADNNKFTLRQAKVISAELIQQFIASWKDIFGLAATPSTTDSTQLFRACRDMDSNNSLARIVNRYKDIEQQIIGYPFCQPIRDAVSLFESWLTERDPQKFFRLIIGAKDNARQLIDRCKEVVQFTHDQLATYKQLLKFHNDNKYNFPFLPPEKQVAVDDFSKVTDDQWPIPNIRGYIKQQRQLSAALDIVREEKRKKVRDAYTATFEQLRDVCAKNNVDISILPQQDATIMQKTAPSNILQLENILSTDAFYQEQVEKILAAAHEKEGGNDGEKKVRQITLQTKTAHPLENVADIDDYLRHLRAQLLEVIENGDSVMVMK